VKGVNWGEADGGHVAALWRPSSMFSLKLSALIQDYTLHGSNDVDLLPGLGDLQQSDAVRNVGGHATHLQAYSATLIAKLGTAELTSVTGYNVTHLTDSFDYTYALGSLTQGIFGVTGTPFFEDGKTTKYSEELRLSVPIGQQLEWLFGVFYTHESSLVQQDFVAENPSTGAMVGTGYSGPFPTTYAEYAGFTDLTYHFTDQFDVQIGGRESENRQTYSQTIVGPFDPAFFGSPSPVVNPEVITKDNSFTYLVTPRFKISPDLMVYARLASGYRPGGPNSESLIYGVPAEFKPDRTENYEIGVKGDVLDHVLSFDASLYYIDWKNIQLEVVEPTGSFESNGSGAKSQGLELSVESRPLQSLTIGAWVAFSDAVLTQNLPSNSANYGLSGNRLPNSSRFTGNLSLEEDFPLPSGIAGFFGGSLSYVGNQEGTFQPYSGAPQPPPPRQYYPPYAKTDLRSGLKYDSWTLNLYVNNLADKRGLLLGGLDATPPYGFQYITPRTLGVSVAKNF
jgi:iron complex outermembrane recepter protein